MSEKRYTETNRQFFEAIDRALGAGGLSPDEIAQINKRILALGEKLNKTTDPRERKKNIH